MYDDSEHLREQVLAAITHKTALNIAGSGSKVFYGRSVQGQPLDTRKHSGILTYEPTELVLTARCGTSMTNIETALAEHRQMLAFEPPYFEPNATLGGTIAAGLSGSRRPYAGSVRDTVLGVKLLNGKGEIVKFGGEVMKNVAGFDLSRLQVGALGTLGIILEVSLKVLPMPATEQTLIRRMDQSTTLLVMNRLAKTSLPLSASCHDGEFLRIRLSGAESALASARQHLQADILPPEEAKDFWAELREQKLPFFQDELPLWRLSLPSASAQPQLAGSWFIDWGGALRWLKSPESAETIFTQAQRLNGHACRFRSAQGGEFQPLSPGLENLHKRLKAAFDPHGIFNIGRMYPGW